MAAPRKVFETVYTLRVLAAGEPHDDDNLEVIAYDVSRGRAFGTARKMGSREIPAADVRSVLQGMGNDGDFFDPPPPQCDAADLLR